MEVSPATRELHQPIGSSHSTHQKQPHLPTPRCIHPLSTEQISGLIHINISSEEYLLHSSPSSSPVKRTINIYTSLTSPQSTAESTSILRYSYVASIINLGALVDLKLRTAPQIPFYLDQQVPTRATLAVPASITS